MDRNFDNRLHAFEMNGPWRCGARADMMLTFIWEDRSGMIGIYASDRGQSGDAFQEKGSILEVPEKGLRAVVVARYYSEPLKLLVQRQFAAQ